MTKIKCANTECEYINRQGNCSLKQINLSGWSVNTVNMGRKRFDECKQFKESESFKELKEKIEKLLNGDDNE